MTRVAYLCVPPLGGLRAFFVNLRAGLTPEGIDLFWLGSGRTESALAPEARFIGEAAHGCIVAPDCDDPVTRTRALIDYLRRRDIQVVLLNSVADPVSTGIAFYLPPEIRRVLIVHSTTPMTYRISRALRRRVHATVCPSPRIREDLLRHHRFDPHWTACIPHGLDLTAYDGTSRPGRDGNALRLLFLGRVEEGSKGVFWLPAILERALRHGADLRLTVAGDGPDLIGLKGGILESGLRSRVDFIGPLSPPSVPAVMAAHDALLMPSRFEGLPFVLLEAMAAGCVPVVSRIAGVTDFVVEHGRTGLLFPVGSVTGAAAHLARLYSEPPLLAELSAAARQAVRTRFDVAEQGRCYAALIRRVLEMPRSLPEPQSLDRWRVPPGFSPGWWYPLPKPLKNALRLLRERIGFARGVT